MGTTYLMSYPGPDWQIRGGANFRSQERSETNPRQALREWIALCDSITRAGGHIIVMPPSPSLTGMIYTANAGQLFHLPTGWTFMVSKMATAHRVGEAAIVRAFMEKAGVPTGEAKNAWEGQADVQLLPSSRFIATYGVRSVGKSLEDLRPMLPSGARLLELTTREPFFHGDTCLNPISNLAGDTWLLAHDGAFPQGGLEPIRRFLPDRVEIIGVDRDDALAYACNSLCVNGTLLIPAGLSTGLRGQLVRRGFTLEEMALGELFGKGGGGPRCLVNELRGLVTNDGAPDYASQREQLVQKIETYPERVAPAPIAAPPVAAAAVAEKPPAA